MKLPIKLTESKIQIGNPNITIQYNGGQTGQLLDRGFDFLLQDDNTISYNNYLITSRIRGPKRIRCGINIPCMRVYDKQGSYVQAESGVGQDHNATDSATGRPNNIGSLIPKFANGNNDHVYIGRPSNADRTCCLLTNTGLSGVPTTVKESWKTTNTLVRLTLKGPIFAGGVKLSPGTTGHLTTEGRGFAMQELPVATSNFHFMGIHSGGIRTIFKTNQVGADGPAYSTALTASIFKDNPVLNGTFLEVPDRDLSSSWCEITGYITNSDENLSSARKHSIGGLFKETEAGFGFEGNDRDIAITPVILNSDGSLNLVAMDNQLNTNKYLADRFISEVLHSEASPNPESPVPSATGTDSLYVRV